MRNETTAFLGNYGVSARPYSIAMNELTVGAVENGLCQDFHCGQPNAI